MNDCERFEAHVSAWLDDELERTEQLELVDHLVRCPSCREFTIGARSLQGWVATVRPPRDAIQPSPGVWRDIERSAGAAIPAGVSSESAWAPALRAAAVLILAVGLGALFLGGPASEDAAGPEVEIRLGDNRGGMDDSRFMELTSEVLRSDPRYHAALYRVMEQVVQDSGAREVSTEFFRTDDAGEESPFAETANRNPV